MALLWPWNCFLSASGYYGDRFSGSPGLVRVYSSTMMSVSTIVSTLYNYYLLQNQKGVSYTRRVYLGLILTVGVFVIMAVSCVSGLFLLMPDGPFFVGLMAMVLVLAVATCYAQNGTMALANVLGGIYANAVMVGQAIAGVLPSIALIVSILALGDVAQTTSYAHEKNYGVFVYYITASLVLVASMGLLWASTRQQHESAYQALSDLVEETPEQPHQPPPVQSEHVPFGVLWEKLLAVVLTIFLTFSITLVFPVFALVVESTHSDSSWVLLQKRIYIPFIYLVWNLGDLVGRVMCGVSPRHVVVKDSRTLVWYLVLRIVFVPLFLTCKVHPNAPALINSDLWYILLQFAFGFSNGQLCTSAFMTVADHCDTDAEKAAAGGFTSVFLSVGLAFGSVLSYLLVLVVG